jgi:hypothetical protein
MLTYINNKRKSTHITEYQTFTRRKNILPRHGRINTNSEDWRKNLKSFSLESQALTEPPYQESPKRSPSPKCRKSKTYHHTDNPN